MANDLHNCSNTCAKWRQILSASKMFWLWEITFPSVTKWLGKNDILNCRLICQKWSRITDNWLEIGQFEKADIRGGNKLIGYTLPTSLLHLDFGHGRNGDMIRKFTEEMSTHPRNPIIGKFVRLRALLTEQCCPMALEFLQNFGDYLTGMEIYFEVKEYQHWQSKTKRILKYIYKCLECVQGIKRLKIFVATLGNYDGSTGLRNSVQNGVEGWFRNLYFEKRCVPRMPVPFPSNVKKVVFGTDTWTEDHVKMKIIPARFFNEGVMYSAINLFDHPNSFVYEKTSF